MVSYAPQVPRLFRVPRHIDPASFPLPRLCPQAHDGSPSEKWNGEGGKT